MRKVGVDGWLMSAVVFMYVCARTVVRTVDGNSDNSEVKTGMHQALALSPLPCDSNG